MRHAIGTEAQADTLVLSGWDFVRSAFPRIATAAAQEWIGEGRHVDKALSVAERLEIKRPHPTDPLLWAVKVNGPGDADLTAAIQWAEDRPAIRDLFGQGPQVTLPNGAVWPDGTNAPRDNHFWAGSIAATQARYLAMRRIVLPDAWSNATAYTVGQTCWRLIAGVPVGFRCVIANTASAPTLNNGNWSAYLGPLTAEWNPVGP